MISLQTYKKSVGIVLFELEEQYRVVTYPYIKIVERKMY